MPQQAAAPAAASSRGTRLAKDVVLTDEWRQAVAAYDAVDVDAEWLDFTSWAWTATSRAAVKLDWRLTWMTWCRRRHKETLERERARARRAAEVSAIPKGSYGWADRQQQRDRERA